MAQGEVLRFESDRAESEALLHWWRDLHGHAEQAEEGSGEEGEPTARAKAPNYRGERAELRRCNELIAVVLTPAYQRLYYALAAIDVPKPRNHEERLATVAGVLAGVTHTSATGGAPFAQTLAQPRSPGGPPRLSELRFRRLLRIREHGELYPMLVRLLRLLEGSADPLKLARGIYGWNDTMRKRWAYDYYGAVFRQGGPGTPAN